MWLFGFLTFPLVKILLQRCCRRLIHLHPPTHETNGWLQQAKTKSEGSSKTFTNWRGRRWVKLKESGYNQKLHYKTSSHFWQWCAYCIWLLGVFCLSVVWCHRLLRPFMFSKSSLFLLKIKNFCFITHCPYLSFDLTDIIPSLPRTLIWSLF